MTIDECKKYLPNRWAEIIQQDPLLMELAASSLARGMRVDRV